MTGHFATPGMKIRPSLDVLTRHRPTNTDSLHLICGGLVVRFSRSTRRPSPLRGVGSTSRRPAGTGDNLRRST